MGDWAIRRIGPTFSVVDLDHMRMVTRKHMRHVERFDLPPQQTAVRCRGLDARGLPKFRVRAGRREVRA